MAVLGRHNLYGRDGRRRVHDRGTLVRRERDVQIARIHHQSASNQASLPFAMFLFGGMFYAKLIYDLQSHGAR
jgi:hypothetical protein